MEYITSLFNINSVFFTYWDYQMSYLEFFGTIFTIWCVWLTAKNRILSWPIGIIGTILYIFLFYQIQLYSDLFEQIYFLFTSFLGWWLWSHPMTKTDEDINAELKISTNTLKENIIWTVVISAGTLIFWYIAVNLDNWFPQYFPESASLPFLDAFTTSMSLVAQWLLVKRKVESWVLWIIVDIIGVWLYYQKGVKFISAEYALFLIIATKGLIDWIKKYKQYEKKYPKIGDRARNREILPAA
ncbi:MAG: nicotinamide riboside transporter PnuC [bacterium]|nr:nicotinamide riboside transporter PnuC [bacterium]